MAQAQPNPEVATEDTGPRVMARSRRRAPTDQTTLADMLALIEQAAKDPQIDVQKFERLTQIWERAQEQRALKLFSHSMASVQADVHRVKPNKENKQAGSMYATYHALDLMMRPLYIEHGFSLSFNTEPTDTPDLVRVVCYVAHEGGHTRKYQIDMPADGRGPQGGAVMTRTHATGSAVTYGKRYLLAMIFNLAFATDVDDDGNAASTVSDGEAANPIYDKIGLAQSREELLKLRPDLEAAKVKPHTRRNLIAAFNKKLREFRAVTP